MICPVGTHFAVALRQRGLGEFGGHAEKARDDHPERGPWPADRNRDRDACDVAEPDRGGKRGGQRLERAHLALVVRRMVLASQHPESVTHHAQVDEAEAQGQVDRADYQPGDDERHRRFAGKHVVEDDAGEIAIQAAEEGVDPARLGCLGELRKQRCGCECEEPIRMNHRLTPLK